MVFGGAAVGAAVGGVCSGALSVLSFFMGVLGAAPEPSESAKRLRSRSPDWDGSGEIGRMEVTKGIVILEPGKFVPDVYAPGRTSCAAGCVAHFVRGRCVLP